MRKQALRRLGFGIAMCISTAMGAWAQEAFFVDGETIGDAELYSAAKAEGSLTHFTVNFEDFERALLQEFSNATGIAFEIIRLPTGRMYERVRTEFSAGQLTADLVSLTDIQLMQTLASEGVLVPHRVPSWDAIPDGLKSGDGMFYAQNRFVTVIGYNTQAWAANAAPTSWKDLLDPKFSGEIGVAGAATGGMSWTVVLFQRKVIGENYWQDLAANEPKIYTSQAPLADDVARGEVTVGLVTPGLVRNLAVAGAPISLNFPEEGAPGVATLVGVTSVAKSPNAAKLYVNWLMSRHGGSAIARILGDYPSHPDAPAPDMSEFGINLPSAANVWLAAPEDWIGLRDQWILEWDEIYRQ